MAPFGVSAGKISVEWSYAFFGLIGGFISFCVVNNQVKFAHFFFEFSETEELLDTEEKKEDD